MTKKDAESASAIKQLPATVPSTMPAAPGMMAMDYAEIPIKGRLYVVGGKGTAAKTMAGELPEMTVSKIGFGPAGETVVFEANKDKIEKQLMAEFAKRHPSK